MFTLEQIKAAHSQVKSGVNFPAYVQALITLGAKRYDVFVADGRSVYVGMDGSVLESLAKYPALSVASVSDPEKFQLCLKRHQAGETDYPTFCQDAAAMGVEKWCVDTETMTCTYADREGRQLFIETIPTV
ncbi:MAG: DUF1398 family protein [Candidatus Moraniibacteriota bacterium]